ncbi:MAG: YadA-like family protein [Pseudomonadota bacterium]
MKFRLMSATAMGIVAAAGLAEGASAQALPIDLCRDGDNTNLSGVSHADSLECGDNADVTERGGTAIGDEAKVNAINGTAIGFEAVVEGNGGAALGHGATVEGSTSASIAIGLDAEVNQGTDNAIAIGRNTFVGGRDVASSEDTDNTGNFGIAIGDSSSLRGNESVILGPNAHINGNQSVAIGAASLVGRYSFDPINGLIDLPIDGAVAIGGDLDGDGFGASAQHENSVALGADSTTSAENTVSVGRVDDIATGEDETIRRRIMNVDDGVLRTDAATVGQVADAVAAANPYIAINSSGTTPMATGENAIAIGQEANVGLDTEGSIAIGLDAHVDDGADHSIAIGENANVFESPDAFDAFGNIDPDGVGNFNLAIGTGATVEGAESVAVGALASAVGFRSTAFGNRANAYGDYSSSNGYDANADGDYSSSNGSFATVIGDQSIALGSFSTVGGPLGGFGRSAVNNAIAIGGDGSGDGIGAYAGADAAIAFGADAASLGESSLAIGQYATVTEGTDFSIAIGTDAIVQGSAFDEDDDLIGNYNIALGYDSYVEGLGSVALGSESETQGFASTAVGDGALVLGDGSLALGAFSRVAVFDSNLGVFVGVDNGIAIGGDTDGDLVGAQAMHANSIALGADSETSAANTLSLGRTDDLDTTEDETITRRIMNVSDGVLRTDAATVGQVADAVAAGNPYIDIAEPDSSYNLAAASATGEIAIAIGADSEASNDAALAIGTQARATAAASLAIGSSSISEAVTLAQHENAIAIGAGSQTSAADTVAFGSDGNERRLTHIDDGVENTDAVTVGQLNAAIASAGGGGGSTTSYLEVNSMGTLPSAEGTDSIALGARASTSTDAEDGVAIGSDASVTAVNAVALGADSVADEDDTVSFGSDTMKRKLTNLAEGEADDDAATYGQLTDLTQTVSNNTSAIASNLLLIQANTSSLNTLTNTVSDNSDEIADLSDRVDTLETSGVGGGSGGSTLVSEGMAENALQGGENAAATEPNSTAYGTNAAATNENATAIGSGSRAEGSTAVGGFAEALGADSAAFGVEAQAHGDQSTAIGEYTSATATGSSAFGTNAAATAVNSVALGAGAVADRANAVSIGSTGNERQLTNVAAGTASTDAVNVAQLEQEITTVNTSISTNRTAISTNTSAIDSNETAIAVNAADIALLEAGVEGDGERFITLEDTVADNSGSITTLNGQVSENQTRVARNTTDIATLNTQFEQLDYRVDALTNHIRKVNQEIDENTAGIAIANALAGSTWLQSNERVAFTANLGYYDGNSAIAFAGAARLSERFSANLALGTVPSNGDIGARAGVRVGW